MELINYLIVGSGPAGVSAARQLKGKGVCMIDVGVLPKLHFPFATLADALASGEKEQLLGPGFETLANLVNPCAVHPKLKSVATSHVAGGEPFSVYAADGKEILRSRGSYAAGGMSNAWGGQLFRYTETDLFEVGDWPIDTECLKEHYDDLERHIGFSGVEDDMAPFLGEVNRLLPPSPIIPSAEYLLERYRQRKMRANEKGLTLGRSRLAVLTEEYRGYSPYKFGETEFFTTEQEGIYTASRTLRELQAENSVEYIAGTKLLVYREFSEFVEVEIEDCSTRERKTLRARHLLLGCGTLHTAQIVLLNNQAKNHRLPFLDHPPTLVPFFFPAMFGKGIIAGSFPVQLVAMLQEENCRDMISFYYPGSLLWSELLADIPLPMDSALKLMGPLMGGMLVAQIWETSHPVSGNTIRIDDEGKLQIDYGELREYPRLSKLINVMRGLGAFSLQRLASISKPGWGFHYAATLPMKRMPSPFQTHCDGRLWNSRRVRVIDGSVLPSLPAKNHSFTLMANAARIAKETQQCGY
jgi:choline dehydrogenase-like flavoprotein